jgi:DNA polymerase III epsilon subunit-like protein
MGTLIIIFVILIVIIILSSLSAKGSKDLDYRKLSEENDKIVNNFREKKQSILFNTVNLSFEESITNNYTYLIFDLETTGLPYKRKEKINKISNWPRIVSIAWIVLDNEYKYIDDRTFIVKQTSPIPVESIRIHKITDDIAERDGKTELYVLEEFIRNIEKCDYIISHNLEFDLPIIEAAFIRNGMQHQLRNKKKICTMLKASKIFKPYTDKIKLSDMYASCLYNTYTQANLKTQHDALLDAKISAKSFIMMGGYKEGDLFPEEYDLIFYKDFSKINKDIKKHDHIFYGKNIVVTGLFDSYERNFLKNMIWQKGGVLKNSISKSTHYVFMGKELGPSKIEKIFDLQNSGNKIQIILEKDIEKYL